MMVVNRPLVRTRDNHQRAIIGGAVLDHDADREQVVVGVGVKSPVLVPLDLGIGAGVFEVQLGMIEAHGAAEQLRHRFDDRVALGQFPEQRIAQVRVLEPTHARMRGAM